jgi:hypothetical protein
MVCVEELEVVMRLGTVEDRACQLERKGYFLVRVLYYYLKTRCEIWKFDRSSTDSLTTLSHTSSCTAINTCPLGHFKIFFLSQNFPKPEMLTNLRSDDDT